MDFGCLARGAVTGRRSLSCNDERTTTQCARRRATDGGPKTRWSVQTWHGEVIYEITNASWASLSRCGSVH